MGQRRMIDHHDFWLVVIGLAAGLINALSSVPQLMTAVRRGADGEAATGTNRGRKLRDIAQVTGNVLWVVYGIGTNSIPLVIFCAINAALVSVLIFRGRERR